MNSNGRAQIGSASGMSRPRQRWGRAPDFYIVTLRIRISAGARHFSSPVKYSRLASGLWRYSSLAEDHMGSADARFEAMVNAYSSDLYRYVKYWLCRSRQLAEDLVQETFLRAWRFLDNLKDESKAKSWLITTLRREHARIYERYQPEFAEVDFESMPSKVDDFAKTLSYKRFEAPLRNLRIVIANRWSYR